jgi:hybrid polyketide synthase/nonribosomal peptide synthetase ACE1
VARLSELDAFGPQSIAPYPPSTSNPEGYIAAKYVSEVFLEKAAQQLGFPVWIHRPSSVVGDDPNNLDLMSNILNYAKKIRAVAVSESWRGYFDFISVEKTAMSIVDEVVANSQAGSTHDTASVKYVYQAGETVVPMSELRDFLEKTTGESFELIPLDEWVVLAEKAGLSPLLAVYLRQAASAQVVLPRLNNQRT